MQTKVSRNGQVLLTRSIRRKLGLHAGDPLEVTIEGGSVVLTPKDLHRKKRYQKAVIVTDPVTCLPVLSCDPDAPKLTSKQVRSHNDF